MRNSKKSMTDLKQDNKEKDTNYFAQKALENLKKVKPSKEYLELKKVDISDILNKYLNQKKSVDEHK